MEMRKPLALNAVMSAKDQFVIDNFEYYQRFSCCRHV